MLSRILICVFALSTVAFGFIFEDFASQTVFCECGPVPPEQQPNCDISTTCQHGTWTTVRQFDMTFGFCDCDLGWYGEFCELSSQIFEHPDLVCFLNFGKWTGCTCTCSAGNFGRFCQFQLFNIQKRGKKCPCQPRNDPVNLSNYVCDGGPIRSNPQAFPEAKEFPIDPKSLPYPKFEPKDIVVDINHLPYSYSRWNYERRLRPDGAGPPGLFPNRPNWQTNFEPSPNLGYGKGPDMMQYVPNPNWNGGQVENPKLPVDNSQQLPPNANSISSMLEQENIKKHNAYVQSIAQAQPHPHQQLQPPQSRPHHHQQLQPPPAQPHPHQPLQPPPQHQWFLQPPPQAAQPKQEEQPKIAIEVHVSPHWQQPAIPVPPESKNKKDPSSDENSAISWPKGWKLPGQENVPGNNAPSNTNQPNSKVFTWEPTEENGKEQSNKNKNSYQIPFNHRKSTSQESQKNSGADTKSFQKNGWQTTYESKKTIDAQIKDPLPNHWQSLNNQRTTTAPGPTWQTIEESNSNKEEKSSLPFVPFWQPKEESKKTKYTIGSAPYAPSENSQSSASSGSTENNDQTGQNILSRGSSRRKEPREDVSKAKNPAAADSFPNLTLTWFETYMAQWANDRLSIIGHVVIFILIFVAIVLLITHKYFCSKKPVNSGAKRKPCRCHPCTCQPEARAIPIVGPERKPSDRSSFTDRLQEWNHMDRPVVDRMSERERKYFDQIAERNLIDRLARGSRNSSTRSSTNFLLKPERDRRIDRSTTSVFY